MSGDQLQDGALSQFEQQHELLTSFPELKIQDHMLYGLDSYQNCMKIRMDKLRMQNGSIGHRAALEKT